MSSKNAIKKKKIHRDCWQLDYAWLFWLKERLPVYLNDASSVINLEFHKHEYNGKTYTQKEAILKMIEVVNYLTNNKAEDWSDEYTEKCNELCDLWRIWWRSMWW